MFQIFEYIGIPFGYLFRSIYGVSGHYLTALFLFCLIIKLAILPLNISQRKSMVNRAKLQPQEKAIREHFKGRTGDKAAMEMNQQVMELYSKNGYNPASGCLPLLIQMPVLLSLYSIITKPLTYLCGLNTETIAAIVSRLGKIILPGAGMTQIQMISHIKDNLPLFSDLLKGVALPEFAVFGGAIDLSQTPSLSSFSWILVVPLMTLLASYAAMLIRQKFGDGEQPEDNQMARSMNTMQYLTPLLSVWISFSVPAVIGVYWIFQNLLDVVQQIVLCRMYPLPTLDEPSGRDHP